MRSSNAIGTARAFCSAGCDASPSAKSLRSADGEVIAIRLSFLFRLFFRTLNCLEWPAVSIDDFIGAPDTHIIGVDTIDARERCHSTASGVACQQKTHTLHSKRKSTVN